MNLLTSAIPVRHIVIWLIFVLTLMAGAYFGGNRASCAVDAIKGKRSYGHCVSVSSRYRD